jgi:hypothetical protein
MAVWLIGRETRRAERAQEPPSQRVPLGLHGIISAGIGGSGSIMRAGRSKKAAIAVYDAQRAEHERNMKVLRRAYKRIGRTVI